MSNKTTLRWMTAVLLLVTWLVARSINADPIWYDEHRSFYYAGWDAPGTIPYAETVARVRGSDVQAPGYYLLLNGWGRVFGQGAFSGRLLSLSVALLAVALAYRLGRDLDMPETGIAAAFTLGVSAFFVVYAHEIRTYALLALVIVTALVCYWRTINSERWNGLAAFVMMLALAALPYLHYLAALVLVALAVYHLTVYRSGRAWWLTLGALVLAGALFLPWVPIALQATAARATTERSTVPTLNLLEILTTTGTEFSNHSTAALLLLLALALSFRRRGQRFAWITAGLMVVLVHLFDRAIPVLNHPRYLIVLWVFAALLVGMGAGRLVRLGVPLALILGVWAVPALWWGTDDDYRLNVNGPGAYAAWDFAGAYVPQRMQEGDLLLLHLPQDTRYDFYHRPIANYYLPGVPVDIGGVESLRLQPDAEYIRSGLAEIGEAERVWYLREVGNLPERHGVFESALNETLLHCATVHQDARYLLDMYITPPQADDATVSFGEGIAFAPYFEPDEQIGSTIAVAGGWLVSDDVPPHTYSVATHLQNDDGEIVAQADYGLPTSGTHCGYGALDLSSLRAGRYDVLLSVYAWETGERLPARALGTDDTLDRIIIGHMDWQGTPQS